MGIVIENEFTVAAAPDAVYELLTDVERVAPAIPGAEVLGRRDDGAYDAKATVKMGADVAHLQGHRRDHGVRPGCADAPC